MTFWVNMIKIHELKNGLRLAYERMPEYRSISIGLCVKAGSVFENEQNSGISHFLEHMAFKGSEKYTARELAELIDGLGGMINASTSKFNTLFYARILDDKLEETLDFLYEIVLKPSLDEKELEREKGVVLEEISMAEDNPEDLVYDKLSELQFKGYSIARSILGEADNIRLLSRGKIKAFRQEYYIANQSVISVVGSFDEEKLIKLVEDRFGSFQSGEAKSYPKAEVNKDGGEIFVKKEIEQLHMCVGFPGISDEDSRRYALAVLSNIFGGGVSSRLFQSIREEKGLVYSIYSSVSSYPSTGDFVVYAAFNPSKREQVLSEIDLQARLLIKDGISEKEIEQTKLQIKTGTVLSQESLQSRMMRNASHIINYGRIIPVEQSLKMIDEVDEKGLLELADELFNSKPCISCVGAKG